MPASAPTASPDAGADLLTPVGRRFVLHWGEMGVRWGVNRTVAQIHALLFLAGRPMHAEEIADTLGVARSNASTSLRELINLKLATVVHLLGDRRDHFETFTDPWLLCRTIVRERKAREFDPTVRLLEACIDDPAFPAEDPARQQRIRATLALMAQVSGWVDELIDVDPQTLTRLMKLGSRIGPMLGLPAPKKGPKR
ncbi:MAG: MarR family transcriptional regulator [Xanthomonadaceae bacterium]|jgi:DNA-binding transcriptional regulator GbsR (MarR family)|nr:MarR family transcriptional regulator [Xanthomonadaceae bacterium]